MSEGKKSEGGAFKAQSPPPPPDRIGLRQMRTLYARSNRLLRIFHGSNTKVLIELGRSYCGSFYCSYLWTQFNKSTISKIRVAYNDLYRKILHVSRRSSAS